jgi:hypothetical protein
MKDYSRNKLPYSWPRGNVHVTYYSSKRWRFGVESRVNKDAACRVRAYVDVYFFV